MSPLLPALLAVCRCGGYRTIHTCDMYKQVPSARYTLQVPPLFLWITRVSQSKGAVWQTLLAELKEAAELRAEAERTGNGDLAAEFLAVEARLQVQVSAPH